MLGRKRPSASALLVLLCCSPLVAHLSLPPSTIGDTGLCAGESPNGTTTTKVAFHRYDVQRERNPLGARDLTLLWSDTYVNTFGKYLVPDPNANYDLESLAATLAMTRSNCVGYDKSDIGTVYDYLAKSAIFRDPLYNRDPLAPVGFKVLQSDYPDTERNHVDTYVYVPVPSADPASPWYEPNPAWRTFPGEEESDDAQHNRGMWWSDFFSTAEDSTAPTVTPEFVKNSQMIPGPTPSFVGDTLGLGWTAPEGIRNAFWCHEFQHNINGASASTKDELLSNIAEAIVGEYAAPTADVPYTWNAFYGVAGDLNYQAFRSLGAYLTYNFRGADTTAVGAADDLVWRWAHSDPNYSVPGLANQLGDANCVECATKIYFAGVSPYQRVMRLLHNWRIANFVNSHPLAEHQYGFGPNPYFVPSRDNGNWRDINHNYPSDDSVSIVPEVVVSSQQELVPLAFAGRRTLPDGSTKVIAMDLLGADYWVIRSAADLAAADRDLYVTVTAVDSCTDCKPGSLNWTPTLNLSVVSYTQQESGGLQRPLWEHPEWADTVSIPVSMSMTRGGDTLQYVLHHFGAQRRAAVVVLSVTDGGETPRDLLQSAVGQYHNAMRYQLTLGLRPPADAVALTALPPDSAASWPAWSPDGLEVIYHQGRLPSGPDDFQDLGLVRQRIDGSGRAWLDVGVPGSKWTPDWSPRGDKIAFAGSDSTMPAGVSQIYVYSLNGPPNTAVALTSGQSTHDYPRFAPNGQTLIYRRTIGGLGFWQLRQIGVDGTHDHVVAEWTGARNPIIYCWDGNGSVVYFGIGQSPDSVYALTVATGQIAPVVAFSRAREFDAPPGRGLWLVRHLDQPMWRLMATRREGVSYADVGFIANSSLGPARWAPDGVRFAYGYSPYTNVLASNVAMSRVSWDRAPVFNSLGDTTFYASGEAPLVLSAVATDPDGDALVYGAAFLPGGASVDSVTGQLIWPGPQPAGYYYPVFRAMDPHGGVASRVVRIAVIGDSLAPGAVADLSVGVGRTSATLTWTEAGDDGLAGQATRVRVCWSTIPITEGSFFAIGDTLTDPGEPGEPGSVHCTVIPAGKLAACTNYYFALKTVDEVGHWSALSNVPLARTRCTFGEVMCEEQGLMAQGGTGGAWSLAEGDPAEFGVASVTDVVELADVEVSDQALFGVRLENLGIAPLAIDDASLVAIDVGPDDRLVLSGARIVVGQLHPAIAVLDSGGADFAEELATETAEVLVSSGGRWDVALGESIEAPLALVPVAARTTLGGAGGAIRVEGRNPDGSWRWLTPATIGPDFVQVVRDSLDVNRLRLWFDDDFAVRRLYVLDQHEPVATHVVEPVMTPAAIASARSATGTTARPTGAVLGQHEALLLSFSEPEVPARCVRRRVLAVTGQQLEGAAESSSLIGPAGDGLPLAFALHAGEPTPFVASTRVRFDLPNPSDIRLEVFDLQGRCVATPARGAFAAGFHHVTWDGRIPGGVRAHAGVYFCRLTAGAFQARKTLIMVP